MRIGVYASIIASERGWERNVSGHIQIPAHTVRLLQQAGHDVHLISNKYGAQHTLPDCVPDGVSMHLVDDGRRRPENLRGGGDREGIRVTRLIRQLFQIRQIVREQRLDVLHVFGYIRSAMLGGVLRRLALHAPVVVTLMGGRLPSSVGPVTRGLLKQVSALIAGTQFTVDQYANLGLHVHLIRHGILRDLREELGDRPTLARHRVLFWRDPTAANGADLCLEAYDELASAFRDVSFDLAVRPIPGVEGIDALEARHDNVHVYRFPYDDDISLPKLMAESLVVLLPFRELSVDPQLAIAESLAAGVPVITTDLRSSPELVQNGSNGILIPAGQLQPVIDGLREVLGDRDRVLRMGQHAATAFEERWNWHSYVDELTSVYERVRRRLLT